MTSDGGLDWKEAKLIPPSHGYMTCDGGLDSKEGKLIPLSHGYMTSQVMYPCDGGINFASF
jgi:hypothetical protein